MSELRFATCSNADIERLKKDRYRPNTAKQTDKSWRILVEYLKEKKIDFDPLTASKSDTNELLIQFYPECRTKKGELYQKTSLLALRFGIQRKLKELRPDIDIINDDEFSTSLEVFTSVLVKLKKEGKGKTKNKPSICRDDIEKMYQSRVCSDDNPVALQYKVFFELCLFFCRRGLENLQDLTKDSFEIKKSSDGIEYLVQVADELTKNHGPSDDPQDGGVMYATGS